MFIARAACAPQLRNEGTCCAFPVPIGFFIWIPNEPYLFNEYKSYLLIQRITYLQFINVKNEVICLHRKEESAGVGLGLRLCSCSGRQK